MTIQERIRESEQKFNELQAIREQHIKQAEEELQEMTKLQGEWRVLKQLEAEENGDSEDMSESEVKVSEDATTIEVVEDTED
jgi:hypothetical protein